MNAEDNLENNSYSFYPPKPKVAKPVFNSTKVLVSTGLLIVVLLIIFQMNIKIVSGMLIVFFIHEMGHFIAMKFYNLNNVQTFFNPIYGAYANNLRSNTSMLQRAVIALAGPVPGIIIGLVLFTIVLANPTVDNVDVTNLAWMFLGINVLNMLPILPLDGGNLFEALYFENNYILQIIFLIGSILLILFISLFLPSLFLYILPIILIVKIVNYIRNNKLRVKFSNNGIDLYKSYDDLTDEEYWKMRNMITEQNPNFEKLGSDIPPEFAYSMKENLVITMVNSILYNQKANSNTNQKILITVIWFVFLTFPIFFILFFMQAK